jgi:septum formation protein
MKFVLASASPRRKELLKEVVDEFEVIPSKIKEKIKKNIEPAKAVKLLAKAKAEQVFFETPMEVIVLGADTIVVLDDQILGKPKDEQDAIRMLKQLSGRRHNVYTGICFCYSINGFYRCITESVVANVYFNKLSDEWIERYVASGSPMDKAGAYGIQDGGLVRSFKGTYANIMGLPVNVCKRLYAKILKELENDKVGD